MDFFTDFGIFLAGIGVLSAGVGILLWSIQKEKK